MSDVIVVVLNELSWSDQEYLDSILKKLSKAKKLADYLIVVHNYYNTSEDSALFDLANDFISGCFDVTEQAEVLEDSSKATWYKSKDGTTRHVFLAKDGSKAGDVNVKTYKLIRMWIRSLTSQRKDTLVELFCAKAKEILKLYLKHVEGINMKINEAEFQEQPVPDINQDRDVLRKSSPFYMEIVGEKQLLYDRLYYEGFRFVLASRNQYELPIDVVQEADGLMVVCDLPMVNQANVIAQEGLGPFLGLKATILTDSITRKSELRIAGVRKRCYFKMDGTKLTDEVVPYEQKDCLISGRHAGPIVGEYLSIPGLYDNKMKVRAIKDGVLQIFIPKAPQSEEPAWT